MGCPITERAELTRQSHRDRWLERVVVGPFVDQEEVIGERRPFFPCLLASCGTHDT
jgi:hypothetical protein